MRHYLRSSVNVRATRSRATTRGSFAISRVRLGCALWLAMVSVFAHAVAGQSAGGGAASGGQGTAGRGTGQQQGATPPQGGLGGNGSGAQPARPAQSGRGAQSSQGGSNQGASPIGGQTSNATAITPAPPSRNQQPLNAAQQPAQPVGGSSGSPGEPAGATTPRAPVNGRGLLLPNTQVPSSAAARVSGDAPATLSLGDAIRIATDNSLTTLLASESVEEARGFSNQTRAALLPNLFASAFQQNRTLNLRAQGFSSGDSGAGMMGSASPIPSFVGPFNTFDARVQLAQSVFNLAAIRDFRAGKTDIRRAESNVELAREQVATFVALSYLNALRGDLDREAARADLILAETLLKLAGDQREAGVATGVDIVRAETRVAQERLRVLQAETALEQSQLDLQSIVGLPQGSALTLTDMLHFADDVSPAPDESIRIALAARPEVPVAELALQRREQDRRARVADQYPSFDVFGDYGSSGVTPNSNNRPTRAYGVRLNVPVFDGGLTRGRIRVAESQSRQAELQLGSTRARIESDVRLAIVSSRTAAAQVRAAAEQLRLAVRELDLARERFGAGVADNSEVVSAQAGLANARALQVQSLVQYAAARLNFAAATGGARSFRL